MPKGKKKPGRKTVMGKAQRSAILKAIGDGGSIADAAGIAKVSVRTVRRHMRQDCQFGIGVLNARKKGKMKLVRRVTGCKSWQASAWYLERIYGKEYGRKDRHEHSGNAGVIVNVTQLSEDDLVRIATRGGNGIVEKAPSPPEPARLRQCR